MAQDALPIVKELKIYGDTNVQHQAKYALAEIEGYMQTVKRYQLEHKVGYMAALKAIDTLKPGLRQAYIRFINK